MARSQVPDGLAVSLWVIVVTTLVCVPAVSQAQTGLVAAWSFNEGAGTTVADVSGNNNTGTLSGATWSTQGRYGNALTFNGANNIVLVPSSSSLNLTTGMTLSAWVFPTAGQNGWRAIVQREVDAYFLHAGSNAGDLRPAAGGTFNGSDHNFASPSAIGVNAWTHLAVTYDGTTMRLFVNGTQVATAPQTGSLETNTKPLRIGGNSPYTEFFLGRIDDVRIYNRPLTATEIQSDMAVSVGGTPPPDVTAPTVAITTPTTNPTLAVTTTPVTLGGTAGDNVGVTQVSWTNDRGGSGNATGTTAWSAANIALLAGDNVVTVTARDAAGNVATDVLTVTYTPSDVTVPTVTITTPTANPTLAVAATPLTLGGTAGDNVSVTQVSWTNDRGGSGIATGTTAWSVASIVLLAGDNILTVTARDAAGNVAMDVLTVTYTPPPDVTLPTVAITAPTANPTITVSATPLTIGGTAGDNVAVTQVSWVNDRGGSGIATGTTTWSAAGIVLLEGDNVLTVTARDAAGNVATDVLTVTYQIPTTPAGLVAAWSFNEGSGTTVTDASGNGNTGTLSGPAWSTQGRYGNALSFDGVNDVVIVNGSSSLNVTTSMTVSAWVFPTAAQGGWRAIVQREVDAYFLHASSNAGGLHPAAGGTVNGADNNFASPSAIGVNTWTHLAVTYDGTMMRLFVNGTQVAATPQTGPLETNTKPLRIGGNSPYTEFFLGRIDDVRIYNRSLAAGEIQSDMAVSVGGGAPSDGTAPTIAITTPTANPTLTVTTTPVTLGGTAGDNVGVTQVTWTNDRGGSGTATGTTAWSVANIVLLAGDNVLTVTARDAAGNVASDVLTVTYAPSDVTVPTVAITTPTANPILTVTTTPLTLGGTAGDNVGVTQVSWTNDRGGSGIATGTTAWSAAGIALLAGDNVLTVTARDAAGNTATDVITVTYQAPGNPSGLVAAWGFNEGTGTTAADVSGNNNTGTISGAAWSSQGRYGNALEFDGLNDVVIVAGSSSLNLTNSMTVSAWVFPTATQGGWRAIVQREVDAYFLHASSNAGSLHPAAGGTFNGADKNFAAPSAIGVSTWTHLAVTYDGAIMRLFVNGTQVATTAQTGPLETNNKPLRIGGNSPYTEFFLGRIDDVRIYNRPLTATEIQSDMAVSVPTAPKLVLVQPGPGSVIMSTTVPVAYSAVGDLTEVNHVHFTLDANPEVMDLSFDGVYQFANVLVGPHVLTGYLVRADHSKILGTDASVSFSTAGTDSIPPSVAITTPASGANLTGSVTLTATASDNSGTVAAVQFYLDATPLGAEITTAPFSSAWNTVTAGNGPHNLTARARDGAGNQTLSVAVPVTVTNSASTDPAVVGSWSAVLDLPLVAMHTALMPDGKILSWDDHTDGTGAIVLDPLTQAVTIRPYLAANLFCAGLNLFPDGRVFVVGGHNGGAHIGITNGTIFNPPTQTWSSTAAMTTPRWYPTVTTLPDGRMLTVGGETNCDNCNALIPEIFNPATGTWTRLTSAPLDLPYYPHDFVLPDGRVIVTGANKREIATYVLDVAAQTWTTVDPTVLHAGSSVMYLPGKFMKSGRGRDPDLPGVPSVATTYVLDMTAPAPQHWRQTASMAFARTEHNLTLLPDGTVITMGGGTNSDVFDPNAPVLRPELWNPATEGWTLMAPMDRPRIYHSTALLLPDGRVFSGGGGRTGPNHLDAQFYSPPYLFKGPRPTISSAPATVGYAANFFVGTPDGANITAVNLVKLGTVTHAFDMNQRFLKLTFQQTAGGLTVQSPGSATLATPGHYMVFILNASGVPSVASIVKIQ